MRFFIVGAGRCGTTLLARMLNYHPDLYVFDETHWIPKLCEFFGSGSASARNMLQVVDDTHHVSGEPTTLVPEDTRRSLLELGNPVTVREFVDQLAQSTASAENKLLWADKTPDYCVYMNVLQELWPETRFVHLIRNGAAVAQSMSRHPGYRVLVARRKLSWVSLAYRSPNLKDITRDSSLDEFLRLWCLRIRHARSAAATMNSEDYLEVRYEHLTMRPRDVLREISRFTGLPDRNGWQNAAVGLVDRNRGRRMPRHTVTWETDAMAVEMMQELGYGESLADGV